MGSKSGVDGALDVVLLDTTGAPYKASGSGGGGGTINGANGSSAATTSNPLPVEIAFGGAVASVTAFHSADNQALGSAYGLYTGGVTQILNPAGTIDRQRGTAFDNIPAAGVSTGTQQLAGPIMSTTMTSGSISAGAGQTVTLGALSFTNRGATQSIQVGTVLLFDTGTNAEYVWVTATPGGTTVTGTFAKAHTSGCTVTAFAYNQARDSTIPDGSAPAGVPSGSFFMWNAALNAGSGGLEIERSAAGELDGASGQGTAMAAEYEWNGGGPLNNSGVPSQLMFDRGRNVQGKGRGSTTLNGGVSAGGTSLTLTAVAGLLPGTQVIIDPAGTAEAAYVSQAYAVGSLTVALQSTLANAHLTGVTVAWDIFAVSGPGTNGFNPTGLSVEEEAIYDPVTNLFYLGRAATADAMAGANLPAVALAAYNGATWDRVQISSGAIKVSTSPASATVPIGGLSALSNNTAPLLAARMTGAAAAANIKASAGRYFGWDVYNSTASVRYLQLYAKATTPVPGTDTPVMTIALPPTSGRSIMSDIGIYAASGLGWAVTTDAAGATAGSATDLIGTIIYA